MIDHILARTALLTHPAPKKLSLNAIQMRGFLAFMQGLGWNYASKGHILTLMSPDGLASNQVFTLDYESYVYTLRD